MLFCSRVVVSVKVRIGFSVLLVSGYAHIFMLFSVVIVTLRVWHNVSTNKSLALNSEPSTCYSIRSTPRDHTRVCRDPLDERRRLRDVHFRRRRTVLQLFVVGKWPPFFSPAPKASQQSPDVLVLQRHRFAVSLSELLRLFLLKVAKPSHRTLC